MRRLIALLWLPIALAATCSAASASPAAASSSAPPPPPPPPDTTHLVDLLSASPDHTLLLAAFQHARLIPTLNRLNGSTLFAPTDAAIRKERERHRSSKRSDHGSSGTASVWSSVADLIDGELAPAEHDNLQLDLRDSLLYLVLNYSLVAPSSPAERNTSANATWPHKPLPLDVPTLHETLYFPTLAPFNKSFPAPPSLPGTEPDRPDPDLPSDQPDGLLHGEGQRMRIIRRRAGKNGKKCEIWVGVDWKGDGGSRVAEPQFAVNGVLLSMDAVLSKPHDLAALVRSKPELSTFASLLPASILDYLSTAPHMTLFAPTNDAWAELTDLEMRYLRSGLAEGDLSEIFGDGASQVGAGKGQVGYLERLVGKKAKSSSIVETVRNGSLEVLGEGDRLQIKVNGTAIEDGNILAKNGVLHTVPRLLLPSGSLALTAEKYLIALGATRYVALLRSVNLSHYVQIPSREPGTVIDTPLPPPVVLGREQLPLSVPPARTFKSESERYTILAVRDDVLDSAAVRRAASAASRVPSLMSPILSGRPLPPDGSAALEELLRYHILKGQWRPRELEDGMLIGTELKTESLRGARQRVAVGVQGEDGSLGDGWGPTRKGQKGRKGDGDDDDEDGDNEMLSWGGANVVADPVVVGDSVIYLLSSLIEPPPVAITAAVSDLRLSTFVASVYAAAFDGTLATRPAVTYLIPTNPAFTALGLTMQYLLLPAARDELRSVLKYHAVDEVVYLADFPRSGGSRYPTLLDGAEIYFEREPVNSTLSVHGPTLGGLPANGESRDANVVEGDLLTETGVLHVVDQVELPPDLDITLEKLLRGAKANTMLNLIRAANMTWVLEGKRARKDDERDSLSALRRASRDQAYTILCPTDKALARLNLTYYHEHPDTLADLIRLHILPIDSAASSSADSPIPRDPSLPSSPLVLADAKKFDSLLSRGQPGGCSRYGSIAFRKWGAGDDDWMVGIAGARGTKGDDAARVLAWGRASPWLLDGDNHRRGRSGEGDGGDDDNGGDESTSLLVARGSSPSIRLAAAGGVISIDSVLIPYEPGWFRRWGWIVLTVLLGVALLAVAGVFAVRWYRKRQARKYERLNSEEDDD